MIYHIFVMMCYFFPIFGAMLADSLLGKFRWVFIYKVCITIYAVGYVRHSPRIVQCSKLTCSEF
jgi:solute carrier family 15 oligopeptide transporter 1